MFNVNEILIIGIIVLMNRGYEYDANSLPIWVEETVNSIPGLEDGKSVDINLLAEKVAKLDYKQLVELFETHTTDVVLPNFSFDERVVIANCICGSVLNGSFVQNLDSEVCDYICDIKNQGLSDADKDFVYKVKNLDYIQRVKLLNEVYKEYFSKS